MKQIFPGVWKKGRDILTRNLVPGFKSYSEELVAVEGIEYRVWDPNRSKASAGIARGLREFPVKPGCRILYLGIASGTTSSHFSDIIGRDGVIYGIEISERSIRDLNPVAEKRGNIVPILGDARKPETYGWVEPVDVVFQDVATNDQSEIMIRNAKRFLRPGGFALLSLKARSIDVTREPRDIYREEEKKLGEYFEILEKIELDPYEKDHCLFLLRKRE